MTKIRGATEFEQAVIEHIIKKEAPKYSGHIKSLLVDRREYTGVGSFLYLKYAEKPSLSEFENKSIGQDTYADIEGLKNGAGFILYIDEGLISMLESFSHGPERWPEYIANFKIKDL